ncbi:hypothetical protein ACH79_36075 [Bradyrhizobium sp. CCBAU 051011]|uniref:hypothetical protein n=1 Tax=Bradyrhizobium sp. CCBAU 051011 TaxID=858422 RepID=UPI001373E508|nr:hypothetical protein [Bradyrhizobium sp. CCBAU 051011]QHO77258.1 hypothetical protein ACH79_36075 [Bradyrhizobium sp. CCBAU 051011]
MVFVIPSRVTFLHIALIVDGADPGIDALKVDSLVVLIVRGQAGSAEGNNYNAYETHPSCSLLPPHHVPAIKEG